MRKVAEVVASLAVGGAERVAVEVAVGVKARGFDAEVIVAGGADAPRTDYERGLQREIEARGVAVSFIPFDVRRRDGRRRLLDHVEARSIDLLHVHNRPEDWQVIALACLAGIPAIYTVHLTYTPGSRKQQALYAAAALLVPKVVCVSQAVADYARAHERVPDDKLLVIYNGIRMDVFEAPSADARRAKRAELGLLDDEFVFVCAARLSDQKGYPFLVEGFSRLPKSARAKLLIAGEGPRKADLEALIAKLGLNDRAVLLGARRDVPALLGAADAYACASLQEGHPLSLLEALSVGLPVVAPRLPSIVEITSDGMPILYGPEKGGSPAAHDPEDVKDGLARVMRSLPDHISRAGAARTRIATHYSLDAMNDAHAALYGELLARPTRAHLADQHRSRPLTTTRRGAPPRRRRHVDNVTLRGLDT